MPDEARCGTGEGSCAGAPALGFSPPCREMDVRDLHQQPQQQQAPPRVGSPPQAGAGGVMMQHAAAFGAAPPPSGLPQASAANVMHGMSLAFNPMASPDASSPISSMKIVDMPLGSMYRPDSGATGLQQQQPGSGGVGASGGAIVAVSGGDLVKKKRGRPRKYGPDGSIGLGLKTAAAGVTEATGAQSGGGGSTPNPDGKRRGRPPGSGKKKQLDALGNIACSPAPYLCLPFMFMSQFFKVCSYLRAKTNKISISLLCF